MNNTMQVYYGQDFLPYKDSERQVHYPIVSRIGGGSLIVGENNTTTLRFYTTYIGGNTNYWVVDVKLPNGQIVYKLLGQGLQDNDTGEWYVDLSISDLYTTIRGEIFVSLKGYSGEISFEEEDDNYFLNGNPTILATGVVKIMVNYAPQVLYRGGEIEHTELEQIIADLTNKLDIDKSIVVVDSTSFVSSLDYASYEVGQLFYAISEKEFFEKTSTSPFYQIVELNYVRKVSTTNIVYGTDNSGNQTTITYSAADAGNGTIVMRGSGGNITVPLSPIASSNATSKSYVDTRDALKVDKSSSTEIVYGTDDTGNQTTYAIDSDLVGDGSIVRRESGTGTVVVGTPTAVNHATTKAYVDAKVSSAYIYKGSKTVSEINALNTSTLEIGWVYNVSDGGTITLGSIQVNAGDNIAWTGSAWDKLAGFIDLSGYVQKTQTIAGISLSSNISSSDLTNALVFASNDDIDGLFA